VTRERAVEILAVCERREVMNEPMMGELTATGLAGVDDEGNYRVNLTALRALAEGATLEQAHAYREGGTRPWAS
jgi:hypothetical protein